jgi:hypothetical protein
MPITTFPSFDTVGGAKLAAARNNEQELFIEMAAPFAARALTVRPPQLCAT